MKIITGTTGQAHITPSQDAMWHRGLSVISSFVFAEGLKFEPQIMTNNLIRVKDGMLSIQGRFLCIEPNTYDEVNIANGSQGTKRIDIVCARIEIDESGRSTASLEVVKGTPSEDAPIAPTIVRGDLDNGDLIARFPLVKVELDGINIESATMIGNKWKPCFVDDVLEVELTETLGDISYEG